MADTQRYPHSASYDRLRRAARDLIDHGVSPSNHGGSLSVDALQLLYQRSSKPESAADALRLLHELQTYQVELDLLYEQLQANELEITEELAHYRSLYEQAPVAYLVIANDGVIIEGNQAAGVLFSQPPTALTGKPLTAFLMPGQEAAVEGLLAPAADQPHDSAGNAKGSLKLADHRWLVIGAKPAASPDSTLMILTETTADPAIS